MSDSLQPHESQHARPPCPSPSPGVHSDSCPSSRWCHPAISSSVVPFSSCPQSLPASQSFPMSQLFAWGGQSIGVSALASFLPKNTQDWSPLGQTGWISLQSKGLSRAFALGSKNLRIHSSIHVKARGNKWYSRKVLLVFLMAPLFSSRLSSVHQVAVEHFVCIPCPVPTLCSLQYWPGEGKGYPLQYSGLENSMDYTVHGVTKSDTTEWLSLSLLTWNRTRKINAIHQSVQCSFSWVLHHHILNILLRRMATIDWIRFLSTSSFS